MLVSCPKGTRFLGPSGLRHLRAPALRVMLAQTGRFTITELCTDFGISRKTGHKYLQRYELEGRQGLGDRSRRPKSSPGTTAEEVERVILKERRKHPTWGEKKT